MSRLRALLLPFLAAGSFALALSPGAEKPDVRARVDAPASLGAGTRGTVAVVLSLGGGWHVNSHTPSESYLVPTAVTLTASPGTLSAVRYPKDVERQFSFSEKPLRVYEGTVRFETDLDLPSDAIGPIAIRGSLSYQACNDRQCFAPSKIPLEASVAVTGVRRSSSSANLR